MNVQHQILHDMRNWIDLNLHEKITVEKLSKVSGYSIWHLQKIFKNNFGISISTYVRHKRLEIAADKLANTNLRIIDISLECGFDSQNVFCRVFLKKFNVTPSIYRSRLVKSRG